MVSGRKDRVKVVRFWEKDYRRKLQRKKEQAWLGFASPIGTCRRPSESRRWPRRCTQCMSCNPGGAMCVSRSLQPDLDAITESGMINEREQHSRAWACHACPNPVLLFCRAGNPGAEKQSPSKTTSLWIPNRADFMGMWLVQSVPQGLVLRKATHSEGPCPWFNAPLSLSWNS